MNGCRNERKLAAIGGLTGIIPSWWVAAAAGDISGSAACESLRAMITGEENIGVLQWSCNETGECYGISPKAVQMFDRCLPKAFAACCLLSESVREVKLQSDFLSYYSLWVNGELYLDYRDSKTPAFSNGYAEVQLCAGLNIIVFDTPMERFLSRHLLSARIYSESGDAEGLPVIGCGHEKVISCYTLKASPFDYFADMAAKEPAMRLKLQNSDDFAGWKAAFKSKIIQLLGDIPEKTPLYPFVEERISYKGVIREKIWIQAEAGVFIPLHMYIPADGHKGACVMALHGHGGDGLDYDYPLRFAQSGYVAITPTFRCFGQRGEKLPLSSKDPCDANFFRLIQYGEVLLKYHVLDCMRTFDYLLTRTEVDQTRIGLTGLSFGGRMTMYFGALEERIKALVVSGAMNLFKERVSVGLSCASQFLPGLLQWGDTPEILGLLAPRPLLMQLGTNDATSPEVYAAEIDKDLRNTYKVLGADDRYAVDVFHEGHKYNFQTALAWFDTWL